MKPYTVGEQDTGSPPHRQRACEVEAWEIVQAAARSAECVAGQGREASYGLAHNALHELSPGHPDALLMWRAGSGWQTGAAVDDPDRALLDLYLPICSATAAEPITVGHLGQSLDGFIATHSGDSQWVTGHENILHLHRMRALCDVVIVGAGTVAADDPQLTTRLVDGSNPLRVILDPSRRLTDRFSVFTDESVPTLYACARAHIRPGEQQVGCATIVGLEGEGAGIDTAGLLRMLRERGCKRIFVEGGGVTVSSFFEADLLDRLHIAVAPLIIGNGRPAIRLAARDALRDCRRPAYRVFRMGGDVLFDCDLRVGREAAGASGLSRII